MTGELPRCPNSGGGGITGASELHFKSRGLLTCSDLGQTVRHHCNKMIQTVVSHRVLAEATQCWDLLNNCVALQQNLAKNRNKHVNEQLGF